MKQQTVTDRLTPRPTPCQWHTPDGRCGHDAIAYYIIRNASGCETPNVPLCERHATQRTMARVIYCRALNVHAVTVESLTVEEPLLGDFDAFYALCACGAIGPVRSSYREASQDGWTHVPPAEADTLPYL